MPTKLVIKRSSSGRNGVILGPNGLVRGSFKPIADSSKYMVDLDGDNMVVEDICFDTLRDALRKMGDSGNEIEEALPDPQQNARIFRVQEK